MISDIGLFLQPGPPRGERVLAGEGPALPWQYRSAVEWWPDVVSSDAEARMLAGFVRRAGEPALEVGVGSGLRLARCRAAGVDIDGLEPSRGLYATCRERLERSGASCHGLYSQPLHELDLPRRYRSVYAGRMLGTSASTEADALGLYRLYRAVEPGGSLLLDHPAPWGDPPLWLTWLSAAGRWGARSRGPLGLSARGGPRWPPALAPCELDGAAGLDVLRLSSEVFEHAPETRTLTYTVRAHHLRRGELIASRGFVLRQRFYSRSEVVALLSRAGFDRARVTCVYVPEARRLLWMAEKPLRERAASSGPSGQAGAIPIRSRSVAS